MLDDPEYVRLKETIIPIPDKKSGTVKFDANLRVKIGGNWVREVVTASEKRTLEEANITYGTTAAAGLREILTLSPTLLNPFTTLLNLYKNPAIQNAEPTGWSRPKVDLSQDKRFFVREDLGWFSMKSLASLHSSLKDCPHLRGMVEGEKALDAAKPASKRAASKRALTRARDTADMMRSTQRTGPGENELSDSGVDMSEGDCDSQKPNATAQATGKLKGRKTGKGGMTGGSGQAETDKKVYYMISHCNKFCLRACCRDPASASARCLVGKCSCVLSLVVAMTKSKEEGGIDLQLSSLDKANIPPGEAGRKAGGQGDKGKIKPGEADGEAEEEADSGQKGPEGARGARGGEEKGPEGDGLGGVHHISSSGDEGPEGARGARGGEEQGPEGDGLGGVHHISSSGGDQSLRGRKRPLSAPESPTLGVGPVSVQLDAEHYTNVTPPPKSKVLLNHFPRSHEVRHMAGFLERMQMYFVGATYERGVSSFHPELVQLQAIPEDGRKTALARSKGLAKVNFGVFPSHVLRIHVLAQWMLDNCSPSQSYGWQEFQRKPPPGFQSTRHEFVRFCQVFLPLSRPPRCPRTPLLSRPPRCPRSLEATELPPRSMCIQDYHISALSFSPPIDARST